MTTTHFEGSDPSRSATRPGAAGQARQLLGGLSTKRFMKDYWQKRPLLIRAAVPPEDISLSLDRHRLFELASRDDVESRLVRRRAGTWSLEHGPFDRLPAVPGVRAKNRGEAWTLLVQGVNLHDDAADALLRRFDFVSQARLDDLMISYATDGGGVGPHLDSYDVFLLQTQGRRRWRIGPCRGEPAWIPEAPLKLLADFHPEAEWDLEPGDMLYLPPGYAHEGTAMGECITCSIGFRAPAFKELAEEFLHALAERIDIAGRYEDPDRVPTLHPARIDTHLADALTQRLAEVKWERGDVADFLGSYFSEPKPNVFYDPPGEGFSPVRFARQALRHGLRLHRKTAMLYTSRSLFINGERIAFTANTERDTVRVLRQLADTRGLDAAGCAAAVESPALLTLLHAWHADGWLEFCSSSRMKRR